MSVSPPEDNRLHEESNGGGSPSPNKRWIVNGRDQNLSQSARQGRHEQEEGNDSGSHVFRGSSVGELICRDVHEDLGQGT